MDVSVPISGVKPFLGPTMVPDSLGSSGKAASAEGSPKRLTLENPAASAAVVFKKLRREGQQSQGVNGVMRASGEEFNTEGAEIGAPEGRGRRRSQGEGFRSRGRTRDSRFRGWRLSPAGACRFA